MTESGTPNRLSVAGWIIYDLANTIFALGVSGLYFATWIVDDQGFSDSALARTIAIAMVFVIIGGPWLGARSDQAAARRPFLAATTAVTILVTFFLGTVPALGSLILYAVALIAFNLSTIIYDAMLPDVSTPATRGAVSGLGVGVGYVGSFIAVILGRVVLDVFDLGYAAVFRSIAVAFALFALPTFLWVRERARPRMAAPPPGWRQVTTQLVRSWRRARRYPGVTRFLVGRFLYTDAINTLIGGFLAVYAVEEIGFSRREVEALLAVAIAAAVAGGVATGRAVDRIGPRRILHGILYLWLAALALGIAAAASNRPQLGWILGVMGGVALGGTWATDRVYMVRLSPKERFGEFYGLYGIVGRFATVLGPLTWGVVVDDLGWGRTAAMGALMLFIVLSRLVLQGVPHLTPE